jgi:FeS assembly SUF system protein
MSLCEQVVLALKKVYDPEVPINIYDMGLVYDVNADEEGRVAIRMTLTAPNCPVAGSLPGDVERAARRVEGVTDAKVELTFDPPWTPERMSEAAKLALGMDGLIPIARVRP